jgi:hypothetical protein
MGEDYDFCGSVPAKDSFDLRCEQNIDSERLIQLRKNERCMRTGRILLTMLIVSSGA